jgi:hypothetical protein
MDKAQRTNTKGWRPARRRAREDGWWSETMPAKGPLGLEIAKLLLTLSGQFLWSVAG